MRHTTIAMAAMLTLAATACCHTSDERQIRQAAQGYLDATGNYLVDEAIPFATARTRELSIPAMNYIMQHADTAYINSNRPATITLTEVKMLSDTSARVLYHKHTPIKEVDDSVTVLKEDGQWLVDVMIGLVPGYSSKPLRVLGQPKQDTLQQ